MSARRKRPACGEAFYRPVPLSFPVTEYEEQAEGAVRSGEYASVGKALHAYSLRPLRIDHFGRVGLSWPHEQASLLGIPVKEYLDSVAVLMDVGAYVYREGIYYHLIPDEVLAQAGGSELRADAQGEA